MCLSGNPAVSSHSIYVDVMNYQKIIDEILVEIQPYRNQGQVADYIPEMTKVDPDKFGMTIDLVDGNIYSTGDADHKFSIQSISKVFSLTIAHSLVGESIWKRVKVEPSGTPFNSLVQLEYEQGIPRNPFINAGAIVIADIMVSHLPDPKASYIEFVEQISGISGLKYNEKVASSEMESGYRNIALSYFLKSYDNLKNDVFEVLDLYFHMCALEMNCFELAKAFKFYAKHGSSIKFDTIKVTPSQVKRTNALMQTCGFYDESGEFSFAVGLPGKSGVGGGVAAIHPQQYSVAVWSPRLNSKGNSVLGMKALELLTSKTETSIF